MSSSLYVHRCHWCGNEVVKSPTSLEVVDDITILCSDCLDWEYHGETICVTLKNQKARVRL